MHRLCALLSAGRRLGLIVILVMAHGTATFAGTLEVVRPLAEAPGDIRYDHYWQLLMQTLAIDFGPFVLRAAGLPMTELRSMQELETGRGTITVLVHGNVADCERRLMPIRFPVDKGLPLVSHATLLRGANNRLGVASWGCVMGDMNPSIVGVILAAVLFGGSLLGVLLNATLPGIT